MAPRIVGALVAASTDYATYRLAIKVLGHGAGETAVSTLVAVSPTVTDYTDVPIFVVSVQRLRLAPSTIDFARDLARHSRSHLLPAAEA